MTSPRDLHSALLHANAIGTAAATASATAAGRVVWGPDDRAAGYRAAGAVLDRLGYGHVAEPEGAWLQNAMADVLTRAGREALANG
jgi:hypothetical protein